MKGKKNAARGGVLPFFTVRFHADQCQLYGS